MNYRNAKKKHKYIVLIMFNIYNIIHGYFFKGLNKLDKIDIIRISHCRARS